MALLLGSSIIVCGMVADEWSMIMDEWPMNGWWRMNGLWSTAHVTQISGRWVKNYQWL